MGYAVHQLDPQTWLIEEDGECNVYMYLLAGDEKAVLIDAGYGTIPLKSIVCALTHLPVTVLCTHAHYDHIGGTGFFSTVLMHRAGRELYRQQLLELRDCVPDYLAPDLVGKPCWFDDGFTLDLGNRTLEIFPVPGHTKGCVAILDVQRRQLFTGDTCCKGAVLLNFDHSSDLNTFRNSVVCILEKQDRFDITWPSHHKKPLTVDIPLQFREAADLLLCGIARGTEIPSYCGTSKMFSYKDISIIY